MNNYLSDIDSLKILISLDKTRSIGKTSKDFNLSQPAVSVRLKNFESKLGLKLVHKDPNGTTLTEAGKTVANWAKTILDLIESYDYSIDALKESSQNNLSFGASQTIADYIMPYAIKLFRTLNPNSAIKLDVSNSNQVINKVLNKEISVGFIEAIEIPRGLHTKVIGEDELYPVIAKTHKFGKKVSIRSTDLINSHLIIREIGSGTREVFDKTFGHLNFQMSPTELSSTTAIKAAIAAGEGIGFISKLAVRTEILNSSLKVLKIIDPITHKPYTLTRHFRAIWLPETLLNALESQLIKLSREVISQFTADEIQAAISD